VRSVDPGAQPGRPWQSRSPEWENVETSPRRQRAQPVVGDALHGCEAQTRRHLGHVRHRQVGGARLLGALPGSAQAGATAARRLIEEALRRLPRGAPGERGQLWIPLHPPDRGPRAGPVGQLANERPGLELLAGGAVSPLAE
jgi:hypothetical protein